ncbi:hypothetical protein L9F63_027366, partial [Diploptera punctata]
VEMDMRNYEMRTSHEIEYRLDIVHATNGAYIEVFYANVCYLLTETFETR